jgi:hypothetical protein
VTGRRAISGRRTAAVDAVDPPEVVPAHTGKSDRGLTPWPLVSATLGAREPGPLKTFALERVIKVTGQLTMTAWLALETGRLTGALNNAAGPAGPAVAGIR